MASFAVPAVVFASDNVQAMPLGVSIASLLASLSPGPPPDLHLLSFGISARNRRRITSLVECWGARLNWNEVSGAALEATRSLFLTSASPYPPASYAPVILHRCLPSDLRRVIYLDCDVIVAEDIRGLWETDLGGNLAAAVPDRPFSGGRERFLRSLEAIEPQDPLHGYRTRDVEYFNSGVVLFDLVALREGLAEEMVRILRMYPELYFPDQQAFNLAVGSRCLALDPRWNVTTGLLEMEDPAEPDETLTRDELAAIKADPWIVHFTVRPKPWQRGCAHPLKEMWETAFTETPWAEEDFLSRATGQVVSSVGRGARKLRKKFARRVLA